MANLTNKLIIKEMPWHANMTELNHLGAALIAKPTVFEGVMNTIFTAYRYSDNPLTMMLTGKGRKSITTTQWEWELKGAVTRPLVIIEDIEPSNTTKGKFRTTFKIKLDEPWWLPGDIIHPGDKKMQCRVQTQNNASGNGYIYEVTGMSDDPSWFLSQTYVTPGTQWAKLYSQYEEGGTQSGSTQYSLPIALASKMGRYRKMYSVTGDAASEVLAVKIPGADGKMYDSWIKYAEVEYWEQWYRELERGLWYSRSTDSVIGSTGRPIYSGPGVQELMEDSHIHYYSILTAKLIEEYLMDIFYSRVKPGKGRKISAFTGEYGMIQFHRAIQEWEAKRKGFIQVVDQVFIQKTSSAYTEAGLQAGFQYVRYRMANGAELELTHCPLYDDREINFQIDPISGYPIESQRFTFFDFADGMGGNNIQIIDKTNSFKLGYVAGLCTPYGPVNKGLMSHSGDYYEMHVAKQQGIHIQDVSRCGELILETN